LNNTFEELGLSQNLLKALNDLNIVTPTDIQIKAIPVLMQPRQNFIGLAQTGTGKTAAFGLPLLEAIDPDVKRVQALVLAPTRELGQQIAQQLASFSKYMQKVGVLPVYGGAAISNQIKDLKRNPQIVIATPGRLIDLVDRRAIDLSGVQFVVLDEADEMLNMGFKEDIDKILSYTDADKSTWLFSATMPKEMKRIVEKYMVNPVEVSVNTEQKVNENIEHQYAIVRGHDKVEALKRFLDQAPDAHGIVFCRTKLGTQSLADDLVKGKYPAEALHGDMSQQQRDRVMKRFKDRQLKLLIATDVAARGIDVNDLTHVINFMLPDDITNYTHRSGRTARAGKKGISLSFVSGGEVRKIYDLERMLGVPFTKVAVPGIKDIKINRVKHWAENLVATEVKAIDPELMHIAATIIGDMTGEEMVQKLIAIELGQMEAMGTDRDLNEAAGSNSRGSSTGNSRERDRDRGDRRKPARKEHEIRNDFGRKGEFERKKGSRKEDKFVPETRSKGRERIGTKSSGAMVRFFINIGTVDAVNKADVINFVCEQGKFDRSAVGEVTVHNKHSFFELEGGQAQKASTRFKNLYLNNRPLRVNEDLIK
jgi:ATP-dependent RNA helicase DeaD